MNKFKCPKCDHSNTKAGFCPDHGDALVETKEIAGVEELLAKIGDVVNERVKAQVKELGLDRIDTKLFGDGKQLSTDQQYEYVKSIMADVDKARFNLATEKEQPALLAKYKLAYFFKHLIAFTATKDPMHLAHVKALAQGVDADGGYTVPGEFRAQLIQDLKDQPVMRNFVTVIPMTSNFLELPTLLNDVKTSWGSENTAINTTTAKFGTLTFTPYRLNTFMYTSRELVNDSALNIIQLITRLFTQAIGREEDRVIVNGSGSGQPKGLLQETFQGIDNANVDANLADNIIALPYRLGKAYRQNARWLINSRSLGAIRGLKASTAGTYLFAEGIAGGRPATIAGYPFEEQNDMPLDTFLFGDFSFYYLADREQVSVETTTEGAGTFEKHQVAIKIVERIDGKVAQTLAFRALTNAGID